MSITKGAMLISNANAVGTELVNKLGGTGYKPVEWADAINLLGISNDDKASALASITEGTYTGDERGSIKYSNCNAVGSMLNKKFSTDRGFKPVEWESAISKLTPLAERTVSGSIVTFSDGADDVPTKLVVTIPPTLSGVSAITETQTGRNILDFTVRSQYGITTTKGTDGGAIISGTASGGNVFVVDFVAMDLEAGKYNILVSGMQTGMTASWTKNGAYGGALNEGSNVITLSAKTTIGGYVRVTNGSSYPDPVTVYVQLTIGQDSEPFEKYTPTQYTASLGRTIYGGEVDIVNGEGVETHNIIDLSSLTFLRLTNAQGVNYFSATISDMANGVINVKSIECAKYNAIACINRTVVTATAFPNLSIAQSSGGKTINIRDDSFADADTFMASLQVGDYLAYPLATTTDFTFTGQEIPTRLGYNAFWSDEGDTEVTYRKDPDIPDPPVQLLNTDNNENNDN